MGAFLANWDHVVFLKWLIILIHFHVKVCLDYQKKKRNKRERSILFLTFLIVWFVRKCEKIKSIFHRDKKPLHNHLFANIKKMRESENDAQQILLSF